MGVRTKLMTVEHLCIIGWACCGDVRNFSLDTVQRTMTLAMEDPMTQNGGEEGSLLSRALICLTTVSFMLFTFRFHNPGTLWVEMAQELLREHGSKVAVEDATTDNVESLLGPDVLPGTKIR